MRKGRRVRETRNRGRTKREAFVVAFLWKGKGKGVGFDKPCISRSDSRTEEGYECAS